MRRFYGGRRINASGGVCESANAGGVQSSNTAPHFGHFTSVSSTSAPQFVQVNAVALAALPPNVSGGFARSFGSSVEVSFAFSADRASALVRALRWRVVYHHRKRMAKYVTTARMVTWESPVTYRKKP